MRCSNGHQFSAGVPGPNGQGQCCPVCGMAAQPAANAAPPQAPPVVVPTFPPSGLCQYDGGIMLGEGQVINAKIQAPDLLRATLKLLAIAGDIAAPIIGIMVEKQSSPIIVPRPLPGGSIILKG